MLKNNFFVLTTILYTCAILCMQQENTNQQQDTEPEYYFDSKTQKFNFTEEKIALLKTACTALYKLHEDAENHELYDQQKIKLADGEFWRCLQARLYKGEHCDDSLSEESKKILSSYNVIVDNKINPIIFKAFKNVHWPVKDLINMYAAKSSKK